MDKRQREEIDRLLYNSIYGVEQGGSRRSSQSTGGDHKQTLREAVEEAMIQIDINEFKPVDKFLAKDICYIMAETKLSRPEGRTWISGEEMDTSLVQQVFQELDHDIIEGVIRKYRQNLEKVKFKRAFLRSVMYNSVFEYGSDLDQEVSKNILFI